MQQPFITHSLTAAQKDRIARLPAPDIHGSRSVIGIINLAGRTNGTTGNPYDPNRANTAAHSRWHFGPVTEMGRSSVEHFVATQFKKAYGAKISEFMPDLMGLYDDATLAAACGLRLAATGQMFLEQYLEHPAEEVLGMKTGTATSRHTMMEVGNLSIARPGYARHLVYWLTMHMRNAGMQWALFSAVPALLNNFRRLGIPLLILAPADPKRISADMRATWGTYYDQQPQVSAVNVESAFKALIKT